MDIPFTCPDCKRTLKITPAIEARGRLKCPCGAEIEIKGDGLRKTQKVLDDFERSLKNLFR